MGVADSCLSIGDRCVFSKVPREGAGVGGRPCRLHKGPPSQRRLSGGAGLGPSECELDPGSSLDGAAEAA